MEDSFKLLSTMSPRLFKNRRNRKVDNASTVLSLKKPLRKSVELEKVKQLTDKYLIIAEGSSTETISTLSDKILPEDVDNSIIVISDSEASIVSTDDGLCQKSIVKNNDNLSHTKYEKVSKWLSKVNNQLSNEVNFDCASSPLKDVECSIKDSMPIIDIENSSYSCSQKENMDDVINNTVSKSFSLRVSVSEINDSSTTKKQQENTDSVVDKSKSDQNCEKYIEDILNDLYGRSWQQNRDVILQQSEKKQKKHNPKQPKISSSTIKKSSKGNYCIAYEKHVKSPWKVCDADTSSSDDDNQKNICIKLNFDEPEILSPSHLEEKRKHKKSLSVDICEDKTLKEDIDSSDSEIDFQSLKDRLLKRIDKPVVSKPNEYRNDIYLENNSYFNSEKDIDNALNEAIGENCDKLKKNIDLKNEENNSRQKKTNSKQHYKKPKDTKSGGDTIFHNYAEGNFKKVSFLSSLSAMVPSQYCDQSAAIFRSDFKLLKDKLAEKLFSLYNESVFCNQIPADTPIQWNSRMRGTAGFCYCVKTKNSKGQITRKARIALATKVLDSADRLRDTMIHEMCHAASWIIDGLSDGHGPVWQSWTRKARTVFPELPPIQRCHNYQISKKYTYRCTVCGYSIGRHSKSLDIERKRCGYCYGVFEILINKKNKAGKLQSVPATPKKEPSGFALFVKNNYAALKKPELNHGDVMKMLGQKFSEMKIKTTT